MAADLLDDIINDLGRGAAFLKKAVLECPEEAGIRMKRLALKKDRYLTLKEPGEHAFRLLQSGDKAAIASDSSIRAIPEKIKSIEQTIASLENQLHRNAP